MGRVTPTPQRRRQDFSFGGRIQAPRGRGAEEGGVRGGGVPLPAGGGVWGENF